MKRYAVREPTHREHAGKIQKALGLKDFAEVEAELAVFAGRRAWVTGDGPKAIFADAVGWLRDRDVLLPGVSRLARLVARERDAATQRLWETLYAALTGRSGPRWTRCWWCRRVRGCRSWSGGGPGRRGRRARRWSRR